MSTITTAARTADTLRLRSGQALGRLGRTVDLPSRWALLLVGAWVLWRTRPAGWAAPWLWIAGGYALIAAVTTAFWLRYREAGPAGRQPTFVAGAAYCADAFFAAALIWRDGGLSSSLYLILALLALKAAALATALPGMIWAPFGFGPLYTAALWLAAGNLAFLADPTFLDRYLLLWVWLTGLVVVAVRLARQAAQAEALEAALARQQAALAKETDVLQRTATDLGDRVLELRSLQEVATVLASTLRTEEALQVIVERLRGVTGSSHCAVALLEAESSAAGWNDGVLNGTLADERGDAHPFRLALAAEPPTLEALRNNRSVRGDGATALGRLLGGAAYIVTPLVSRGQPIGVLCLAQQGMAESDHAPTHGKTEQLIASFAYFAATAIENARLYDDAWEKRRELEAVLAGIGDGVVVADPDLHLILMNPVAQEILALEEEPPVGVPLRPYLSSPGFADLLAETLQSQREVIRELDLELARRDATAEAGRGPRTYGALASPVLDAAGAVSGVVAVLRDITAQKELERMKSNFLSVVSHELRTPLHSIKGFVEIILMGKTGPVTELQEDFLKTVRSQTTVLQKMIDDLLEFSRMEAGRVKLHLSEVSLPAMAQSVATRLAPLAEEAGLQLSLDLLDPLPEIDGDRVRLEQVLTNLVENAIKFTPAGGRILVSGQRAGERVRLTVADTGIGIPPEEQARIFDRFYQVDGSERRAYRGTGLGLSICKHIVERHNGRIWVESDGVSGHGSRFHVELPVELRLVEAPTIDFAER